MTEQEPSHFRHSVMPALPEKESPACFTAIQNNSSCSWAARRYAPSTPKVKSMRVALEVELEGLDVPEFGQLCHPEDAYETSEG